VSVPANTFIAAGGWRFIENQTVTISVRATTDKVKDDILFKVFNLY
jgi:hypothetical protein